MGWFNDFTNKYPFTNFHELNLSWFLDEFIRLEDEVKNWFLNVTQSCLNRFGRLFMPNRTFRVLICKGLNNAISIQIANARAR